MKTIVWNFLMLFCVELAAQEIVINKVYNGGQGGVDIVELLIIKNNLNMRGMIIRDFAVTNNVLHTDSVSAGSGYYVFADKPEWSSVVVWRG